MIKLAEALDPIVKLEKSKKAAESIYWDVYKQEYHSLLNQKLGLVDPSSGSDPWHQTKETDEIKDQFWKLLQKYGLDFTNTFRVLSQVTKSKEMTAQDFNVLDQIVGNMIPKTGMLKSCKSQYASQPKILEILKIKPEILRLYGIDPDHVLNEIEQTQ